MFRNVAVEIIILDVWRIIILEILRIIRQCQISYFAYKVVVKEFFTHINKITLRVQFIYVVKDNLEIFKFCAKFFNESKELFFFLFSSTSVTFFVLFVDLRE